MSLTKVPNRHATLLRRLGVATLAVLALSATPALAARGHAFRESFKPEGAHALSEPGGVAVNEATGDVYVVDRGNDRVEYFSGGGVYRGELNGSGALAGEETEAGNGGQTGEVVTGRFEDPEDVAVDNSCSGLVSAALAKCEAEDPSYGDLYVVDAGHRVIDKYSAAGKYVGQLSEDGSGRFGEALDGVAVDRQGVAWVYLESGRIDGFSNGAVSKFERSAGHLPAGSFGLPHGIAVDAAGDFYLRHTTENSPRVSKVAPAAAGGEPVHVLIEEVDGESSSAVAVESSTSDALIDNLTTVGVFDSTGRQQERLGAGHLGAGAGIGVDASAETFFVGDSTADEVFVFGPVLPSAPTVEGESIEAVAADSATLGAEIDPRSEAADGPTEYHFEYGACPSPSPGSCVGAAYGVRAPVHDGQIAPDFAVHAVSVPIRGLTPGTTYHFRAIATNSHGEGAPGEEQTFTTQTAGGELVLRDDRGWELVSPPDKQGAAIEPLTEAGVVEAAADGQAITYLTNAPIEAQPQGAANKSQVLSSREAGGWSSREISLPHVGATGSPNGEGQEYKFFNPELTLSAVQPFGEFNPGLSEEASESTAYVHSLSVSCSNSCYRPLVTGTAGFADVEPAGTEFGEEQACKPHPSGDATTHIFCGPEFLGASDDLSQVVLRSNAALKQGAGGKQLYEWTAGQLAQVSLLPEGKGPAAESPAANLGLEDEAARGAISADGVRVVWESAPNLYLRDVTRGETVQLDAVEAGCKHGCTRSGDGRFQFANTEGSRVFFTDTQRLTEGSGAEPEGSNPVADLYECRIAIKAGKLHCDLTDLTPKQGAEAAAVKGGVLGASEVGSYVYFVAEGVQSEANTEGKSPVAGQPNLYVSHEGSTSYVATLSSGDEHDWDELSGTLATLSNQPTRVSPNGQYLEFMSQASPTGYDNIALGTTQPAAEVYLYNAAGNKLVCASCEPTGARPVGVDYKELEAGSGGLSGGYNVWERENGALVAANVPGWTAIATGGQIKNRYQPRYLDNAGRLFFNTADELVPQDSNGTQDVYEYEPAGIKGPGEQELCTESSETYSARSGGCVNLISSGGSNQESAFLDASESGDDVFFLTSAKLSPLDTDASLDVYDAHVCSDSPCITGSNVQSPPCTTEASCKPAPSPQPSLFGAPASATFAGPGNLAPVAAVKAKAKPLTRAQKLAAALKACRRDKKKAKRVGCEKTARKRFGPVKRAKKKAEK
jgi:DNA-binding beta-propeller fold protein YncE